MKHIFLLSILMTLGLGLLAPDSVASGAPPKGGVAGIVLDDKGNPVAGAKVTITNSKGYTDTVRTNRKGRFGFPALRPGMYKVTAGKRGVGKDRAPAPVKKDKITFVRLKL